jgi:hypothetical protein
MEAYSAYGIITRAHDYFGRSGRTIRAVFWDLALHVAAFWNLVERTLWAPIKERMMRPRCVQQIKPQHVTMAATSKRNLRLSSAFYSRLCGGRAYCQ